MRRIKKKGAKVLSIIAPGAKFLKGSFTITFEPMEKKVVEESLVTSFSFLKQDQFYDVTLQANWFGT